MIEDPPLLTIRKPSRRPTEEQIAAFKAAPTSFVADAMMGTGALIGPEAIGGGRDLVCVAAGPALTVDTGPGDILALGAAMRFVREGDVVVSSCGGHRGCAAAGDRVCGMLRNNGAAGFVTDGPMRDYDGIVAARLPAWCAGLSPNSPAATGPGRIGLPIQIGGRTIETGDMIVADRDGVVVVPFGEIDRIVERLATVSALEAELDAKVAAGHRIAPAAAALLDGDQVTYVD
ncbi:MAG: RraA family protein [Pseudomonadota bacterium]